MFNFIPELSHEQHARIFRAFSDTNRLAILEMLRSGEKCACKLIESLGIGQSTLSHHMKILCESGVVQSRRSGKWTFYSINPAGAVHAEKLLRKLTTVKQEVLSEKSCS